MLLSKRGISIYHIVHAVLVLALGWSVVVSTKKFILFRRAHSRSVNMADPSARDVPLLSVVEEPAGTAGAGFDRREAGVLDEPDPEVSGDMSNAAWSSSSSTSVLSSGDTATEEAWGGVGVVSKPDQAAGERTDRMGAEDDKILLQKADQLQRILGVSFEAALKMARDAAAGDLSTKHAGDLSTVHVNPVATPAKPSAPLSSNSNPPPRPLLVPVAVPVRPGASGRNANDMIPRCQAPECRSTTRSAQGVGAGDSYEHSCVAPATQTCHGFYDEHEQAGSSNTSPVGRLFVCCHRPLCARHTHCFETTVAGGFWSDFFWVRTHLFVQRICRVRD